MYHSPPSKTALNIISRKERFLNTSTMLLCLLGPSDIIGYVNSIDIYVYPLMLTEILGMLGWAPTSGLTQNQANLVDFKTHIEISMMVLARHVSETEFCKKLILRLLFFRIYSLISSSDEVFRFLLFLIR